MQRKLSRILTAACIITLFVLSPASAQDDSEMVGHLSKELGVTADQARGGAGALFSLAKHKMDPASFTKLAGHVPGMDGLLKAAPGGEEAAKAGSKLGTMAAAAGAFKKLGMNAGMVAKFVPALTKFVGGKGGPEIAALLAGALK
jgi:hypothetical protein